ncbi:hypothetical protein FWG95_02600 [Candidatus Saccharibacteria bacterium]|nr:hypothetical protein [Candidatus Saccharibacteria bacterium]
MCAEGEGLEQLYTFLNEITSSEDFGERSRALARSILHGLVFVGRPELDKATDEIAGGWQEWLDSGKDHRILLPSIHYNPPDHKRHKSQVLVLSQVLQKLALPQAHAERGSLHDGLKIRMAQSQDLGRVDPDKERVVILDDWMITGLQMRKTLNRLFRGAKLGDERERYLFNDEPCPFDIATQESPQFDEERLLAALCIELVAGSHQVIDHELMLDIEYDPLVIMKAQVTEGQKYPHISGSHSSALDGFCQPLQSLEDAYNERRKNKVRLILPRIIRKNDTPWQQVRYLLGI